MIMCATSVMDIGMTLRHRKRLRDCSKGTNAAESWCPNSLAVNLPRIQRSFRKVLSRWLEAC